MVTTAYEKWLIMYAKNYSSLSLEENIAQLLINGCREQNPQSFEIVERVGDKEYSHDTFLKAARMVIEERG